MNFYVEFLFWGFLGFVNLGAAILIYKSTKSETQEMIAEENEISTRTAGLWINPRFSAYVSLFTGIVNMTSAFFRMRRIELLEIPTIPWIVGIIRGVDGGDAFLELLKAKWLVAMNDWTSLLLVSTFVAAGFFNFATVRQLQIRDRYLKKILIPAPRTVWYGTALTNEKMEIPGLPALVRA